MKLTDSAENARGGLRLASAESVAYLHRYSTNGFTDIFIVTNNVTVGSITNYLDIGAATNIPSRFYRARLLP